MDSATNDAWVTKFQEYLKNDPSMSSAVAAIKVLLDYIRDCQATTLSELRENLTKVIKGLTESTNSKITSVSSGCDLFLRFITLKANYEKDFEECKKQLIESGEVFLQKAQQGRAKIAPKGAAFIRDGATVLTHSRSRAVLAVLIAAANKNKRFSVYVTETRPHCTGAKMAEKLEEAGIPTTLILDSAVGYIIEKVDLVLVGAEAVVESGGIVNSVGTYQMAIIAKTCNKPFYAVAESFKFVRLFPLKQSDIPPPVGVSIENVPQSLNTLCPFFDYTPPSYISLLMTDLGMLTPSAVSDELIKLYY